MLVVHHQQTSFDEAAEIIRVVVLATIGKEQCE